jgi:hypothetical protein
MPPLATACLGDLPGIELRGDSVEACKAGRLDVSNDRQDVGRKLRRLCLAGHAHALNGSGGSGPRGPAVNGPQCRFSACWHGDKSSSPNAAIAQWFVAPAARERIVQLKSVPFCLIATTAGASPAALLATRTRSTGSAGSGVPSFFPHALAAARAAFKRFRYSFIPAKSALRCHNAIAARSSNAGSDGSVG